MTRTHVRPFVRAIPAVFLALATTVAADQAAGTGTPAGPAPAQSTPAPKPLTNADIITMFKKALPDSTIIAAMRANPIAFDVSMDGLIAMKDAGVSARVMDAMVAAVERQNAAAARTARASPTPVVKRPAGPTPVIPASNSQPSVSLIDGDARRPLPSDRTKMMQAKQKPTSLKSMAKDNAIDQALRAGLAQASQAIGGGIAGSMVGQTGGTVARGAIENKSKTVGYVWALPGVSSPTILPSTAPSFELSLGKVLGVNPEDYMPVIIILTPTAKDWRLVGATEGKESASATASLDWPLYSGFVEDRVASDVTKLDNGGWRIAPTRALVPGEYAVVFRPVSNTKKFRGIDVARNQGDGLMFNSVWPFSIR